MSPMFPGIRAAAETSPAVPRTNVIAIMILLACAALGAAGAFSLELTGPDDRDGADRTRADAGA